MIVVKLQGGIGNQLFEYAFGRSLSIDSGIPVAFDAVDLENGEGITRRRYLLDKFAADPKLLTKNEQRQFLKKAVIIREADKEKFDANSLDKKQDYYFDGMWQSQKYFAHNEGVIRADLELKEPLPEKTKTILAQITGEKENSVCIQVRRGDYVTNAKVNSLFYVCGKEYFAAGVEFMKSKLKDIELYVVSDDIAWCKENFDFDIPTVYVSDLQLPDFQELYLISKAKNFIISNSSFGWWGAWLSANKSKIVVAPKLWFKNSSLDLSDILPTSWVTETGFETEATKPLVSVIMSARNVEKYIETAIQSVIGQTYQNWELVIVDDSSTDSTPKIVQKWTERDERIKSYFKSKNEGQAIARNEAVGKSSGTLLAILDADDIMLPRRLENQVAYMNENPDIAVLGSHAHIIDEDGKITATKRKPLNSRAIHFSLTTQNQFIHSTVMIRRKVFEAVGGYDTNYLYAEDFDLWNRIKDDYKLGNFNDVLSQFRVNAGAVTSMSASQKIQKQNYLNVVVRNLRKYIPAADQKLAELLFDYQNNRLGLFGRFSALLAILKLIKKYKDAHNLTGDDKDQIDIIRRNHILNVLRSLIGK